MEVVPCPLLPTPADDVNTDRPITHWIDTNVMLEVYSHGDLYEAWALRHCAIPSGLLETDPERRRMRMQGSLWMAMALCRRCAVTITFGHENLNNIVRIAPPDSEVGGWTSTILYVLGDGGVFHDWHRLATDMGRELSNRNRDRLMERTSADDGLVLISRDERALREANAMGVDAVTPETYAERVLSREEARTMYMSRFQQALSRYIARGPLDEWLLRTAAMNNVGRLPRAIWSPGELPWFPTHQRAHWRVPLIR